MTTIQEFSFSVDLLRALLWQYEKAENLQSLLADKKAWYDANQTQFWEGWIRDVFDLRTASEFGLIVWSVILDLPLFVNSPPDPGKPTFGFDGAGGDVNFDNGNFTDSSGSSYYLPLETKRLALRLRYFQLTSAGTAPEINRMLKHLFADRGKAFLNDFGNMAQQYVFAFPVTWDLAYLFNNYDILPRPAGVSSTWVDATLTYFGFEPYGGVFDQSTLQ